MKLTRLLRRFYPVPVSIFFLGAALLTGQPDPLSRPKNVILMICDGCGFNHVDAASYYEYGKTGQQVYEQFTVMCAMSTYSASSAGYDPEKAWADSLYINNDYTDSAAAATAMATGQKTYNKAVGMDTSGGNLLNITEFCENRGMATGVVTSVQFCDATPAAFVTHQDYRESKQAIAGQMIQESGLEVLMGAGHPAYDNTGRLVEPGLREYKYVGGEALWNQILAGEAGNDCDGDGVRDPWLFIERVEDFQRLAEGSAPKRVLGIARVDGTLQEKRAGDENIQPFTIAFNDSVPTLRQMAAGALHVLNRNPSAGFFLMIEGGAVDWTGHDNLSGQMIEEMLDFNAAVKQVVDWIENESSWNETLLIVTADHETGCLWGPSNGGGLWPRLENRGAGEVPGMEWYSTKHTNSLVPFYAHGAGAGYFQTLADQEDPVRGVYLDNAELGKALFYLMSVNNPD